MIPTDALAYCQRAALLLPLCVGSWAQYVLWGDSSNRDEALEAFRKKHHLVPKKMD